MLAAAAVMGWSVVAAGYGLVGVVRATAGDTATGIGQFLIGFAALVAAITGWLNGRKINRAEGKAETAATKAETAATHSADAAAAIGPKNGKTVQQALAAIEAHHQYQRTRNHDILNALAGLAGSVPLLLTAVEKNTAATAELHDELRRTRGDTPEEL